jgi:hypothetical protein
MTGGPLDLFELGWPGAFGRLAHSAQGRVVIRLIPAIAVLMTHREFPRANSVSG